FTRRRSQAPIVVRTQVVPDRAGGRSPSEHAAGFLRADATVGSEAGDRADAEGAERVLERQRLGLLGETDRPADGRGHFSPGRLAVLAEEDRARRRFAERAGIETGNVVDMHVRPDVHAPPDMRRPAALPRYADQLGKLVTVRVQTGPAPVDEGRADHYAADTPGGALENDALDAHSQQPLGQSRHRHVFAEHTAAGLAESVVGDDARAARVDERLARPFQGLD